MDLIRLESIKETVTSKMRNLRTQVLSNRCLVAIWVFLIISGRYRVFSANKKAFLVALVGCHCWLALYENQPTMYSIMKQII